MRWRQPFDSWAGNCGARAFNRFGSRSAGDGPGPQSDRQEPSHLRRATFAGAASLAPRARVRAGLSTTQGAGALSFPALRLRLFAEMEGAGPRSRTPPLIDPHQPRDSRPRLVTPNAARDRA